MAFWISALLLMTSAFLLVYRVVQQHYRKRQIEERLQGRMLRTDTFKGWVRLLGESRVGQQSFSFDDEAKMLLDRIGWRRASQRALYAASLIGTPLVALLITLIVQQAFNKIEHPWIAPMFALGLGYLLPKRLLAAWASARQKRVVKEISTFIPILRILFESGMAVEQSLRVISEQGQDLLPILTGELRVILQRVDSGLELGEELGKAQALMDVSEFTDTCVILQQLIYQGGGAMKSLLSLKKLLDARRLTNLQEYISKLSAKMSVVMMVFLFPALLIVLAGPGFTAIGRAFSKGM